MKSLETFEETFSDAVLGYLSTLIFSSFFFRYFRRKIVLLRHRAVVAYECLFSGLHDICNTFTQVAERYNVLILRKSSDKYSAYIIQKRAIMIMVARFYAFIQAAEKAREYVVPSI